MATIEERAEEKGTQYYGWNDGWRKAFVDGYNTGAIEQKQIDDEEYRKDMRYINIKKQELIDKACEWLDNELYQIKSHDFRHPEDIASSTYYKKTELLKAFRKAMEELNMNKYKAKVVFDIEMELPEESGLNADEWLKMIASNIAYHKELAEGRVISETVEIEKI